MVVVGGGMLSCSPRSGVFECGVVLRTEAIPFRTGRQRNRSYRDGVLDMLEHCPQQGRKFEMFRNVSPYSSGPVVKFATLGRDPLYR